MDTRTFSDMKYPVFMSYAHDDDMAWNNFVTNFDTELNCGLAARLRDLDLPRTHLSSKNGPINGPLNDALRRAIDGSFAMMLFVHDGYLRSPWCLQELKHFKTLFGDDGFIDRLYIVAMSHRAIKNLERHPDWIALFPSSNHVWMPFFDAEHPDWPMNIYVSNSRGNKALVASEFLTPFFRLREDLVERIREKSNSESDPRGFPVNAVRPAAPVPSAKTLDVMVFIESEPGQEQFWEPLGQQVAAAWDQVVALEPKEPQLLLRPTGLPMHDLHNRPRLDDADGVILLWGEKATESLLAQIAQVEPKLSGPHLAPGLIAYLTEVGKSPVQPVPETIRNWPVVRFATRYGDKGSATVVADDQPKLVSYLRDVLAHKRDLL
jgi:hypothetical protein